MTLATLRNQVRDVVKDFDTGNLSDSTLDDLIERATQRIETDYADDYGTTPRQMIEKLSQTVLSTGWPIPSDWLRARAVRIGNQTLRYTAPENMPDEVQQEDATLVATYYKKLDRLVNDTDTNWLLDTASRVYVYATAIEYAIWNKSELEDKGGYMAEYVSARDATARANSPRPSGGFGRQSGHQQGYYTIVGTNLIPGYKLGD